MRGKLIAQFVNGTCYTHGAVMSRKSNAVVYLPEGREKKTRGSEGDRREKGQEEYHGKGVVPQEPHLLTDKFPPLARKETKRPVTEKDTLTNDRERNSVIQESHWIYNWPGGR